MPPSLRTLLDREALGALVLAGSFPFLFFHERFQPELSAHVGSTSVDLRLSDGALLVVLGTAVVYGLRFGPSRLTPGRILWLPAALLALWLAFQTLRPVALDDARFDDHVVSFLKFVEYGLLAAAVPLLVRRTRDLVVVLLALVAWCAVAVGVAVLQFLGLEIFAVSTSGWRYSSFLGRHDLAALAAVAASLAAAGIVADKRRTAPRWLFTLALVGGSLGLVLAGSVAAAGGFALGAVVLWFAARKRYRPSGRRVLALAALVAAVAVGVTTIRSEALDDFLNFVGLRGDEPAQGVETYSQRTVLAYIGLRIWRDNSILGVGWQRSSRPEVFERYVPDARERFPDVVDLAFPAEGREWGVQNLYIQMLADAGVIGLTLLLMVGAAGLVLAWRTAAYANHPWAAGAGLTSLCALVVLAGEWASLGIVSGIPLQAATCLVLGLAAAGAATVEEETDV